jgi:hypothetical protein
MLIYEADRASDDPVVLYSHVLSARARRRRRAGSRRFTKKSRVPLDCRFADLRSSFSVHSALSKFGVTSRNSRTGQPPACRGPIALALANGGPGREERRTDAPSPFLAGFQLQGRGRRLHRRQQLRELVCLWYGGMVVRPLAATPSTSNSPPLTRLLLYDKVTLLLPRDRFDQSKPRQRSWPRGSRARRALG